MGAAYETAKAGGKHQGMLRIYRELPEPLIVKAMRSLAARAAGTGEVAQGSARIRGRNRGAAGDPAGKEPAMSDKAAKAVLEEMLSMAIDDAVELRDKPESDAFSRGQVFALYNLIAWGKTQAQIMGLEFGDKTIAAFDPDKELLNYRKRAA